jgi:hypothetical protein
MYGLRQASLLWNRHLDTTLGKIGFLRSKNDPCVYSARLRNGDIIILAVVVDDIIAAATNPASLSWLAQHLRAAYRITDLGPPALLIGLTISRTQQGLTICQNQFIRDLVKSFGQENCNPVPTPSTLGVVAADASPLLPPGHRYLSLVGSLLWCTITRPDIAVAVAIACTKSVRPTQADWNAAIRILRYLFHTLQLCLCYTPAAENAPLIATYVDSAWGNARKSRSRYGFLVLILGNPVLWLSKVTTMVCLSTAEAEYYAAVHAAKSSIWLANLVAEITYVAIPTVTLYEDNAACIQMANNPVITARNRHFAMRMWWLRDQVANNAVKFVQVPTIAQLADIFTKLLPAPVFLLLCKLLFAPTSLHYQPK